MSSRVSLPIVVAVLAFALFAGFYASSGPDSVNDERNVTIETCESLPDYDFERMLSRVERIKGMQSQRNVSICVEQTAGGIDTGSNQRRFARIEEPGLSFFGLDATTNSQGRSSLGHTSLPMNDGPVSIFLANETAVENVAYISYEGLVAHELSHAIDGSHRRLEGNGSGNEPEVRRTTDWLLANRAISEGTAMYVSDLYVQKYDGELDISKLGEGRRGWEHRILVSTYVEGYRYSENATIVSSNERRVNSTAQILHPGRTGDPGKFPARPNLSAESFEHVRTDRVGELFLREILISNGVRSRRAAPAAGGWTNDRMDYYRANDSTAVTWRVTWQNASEMAEFVETYDTIYDYERVDALRSVSCRKSGRYLVASEKTVTVLHCGG